MFTLSEAMQIQVCSTLRCLVEEWGAQRVKVKLPFFWSTIGVASGGLVCFEYSSNHSVDICVDDGRTLMRKFPLIPESA